MQARLRQEAATAGPALADVLTATAVSDFVKLPGMLDALREHLPEGHRTQVGLGVRDKKKWLLEACTSC